MKRLKFILPALFLLLVVASNTNGQDALVQASATVIQQINVGTIQNVNFGDVPQDLDPTPTLTPESNTSSGVTGTFQFGHIPFNGESGKTVVVTFTGANSGTEGSETLTQGTNTDEITMTIEASEDPGTPGTPGGTDLTSGGTFDLTDTNGDHVIYVGGTLSTANAPLTATTYTGTVNFTIDYSL